MRSKNLILSYFLFSLSPLFSQDKTKFNVTGTVAKNIVMPLEDATVTVHDGFDVVSEQKTAPNGKFSLALDMNKIYTLEFSKALYVTKKIELNTEPPEQCRKKTFDNFVVPPISLSEIVEGINYKIYKKPFMYFQYSEKCKFGRDEKLYTMTLPHINQLEKEIFNRQKDLAKNSSKETEIKQEEEKEKTYNAYQAEIKKEEEKEKFQALAPDEKYNELIKQADVFFKMGNYETAKKKYTNALQLKPGDARAEQRLIETENFIAELKIKQQQNEALAQQQKKEDATEKTSAKHDKTKKEEKKTEALLLRIADDSASKAASMQLEKQREIERINDMKSIIAHAQAKRIFLEDIADSKMKMKKNTTGK